MESYNKIKHLIIACLQLRMEAFWKLDFPDTKNT
jgi:hypothetical protein